MYRKYMTEVQFRKLKQEQLKMRYMNSHRVKEVFPDIEKIEISYQLHHVSAFGKQDKEGIWTISPDNPDVFVIDCPNRECSSAGFDLKSEIYSMRRNHLTEKTGEMRCEGQEAPDHPEQSCSGTLKYKIMIVYK